MRIKVQARGKINWTLSIRGRMDNGYHALDMLMQSIELADEMQFIEADRLSLQVLTSDGVYLPNDDRNLVVRAAKALSMYTGCKKGAAIQLIKYIPMEAGLGGGSSDAAAALIALNRLWETCLSTDELEKLAADIGADVPFCICGGLQHALGIGENLRVLENPDPIDLLLIQPCKGLSTKDVFNMFDQQNTLDRKSCFDSLATAKLLQQKDLFSVSEYMGNDLQNVACKMRPSIQTAIEGLKNNGALCAQMTGSGTVVFGVYPDQETCAAAAKILAKQWNSVFITRTAKEGQVLNSFN